VGPPKVDVQLIAWLSETCNQLSNSKGNKPPFKMITLLPDGHMKIEPSL
jgi:hypothetical protein